MNSEDIEELKSLLKYATRENVKNFLTKAINDAEKKVPKSVVVTPEPQKITFKSLSKYYWTQEDKDIVYVFQFLILYNYFYLTEISASMLIVKELVNMIKIN